MPGANTGRDFDNAFDWDHTLYPGGNRVFGETARYNGTGINRYDYWAVTLEKGRTYSIQTRVPTAFNTYLYLYNEQRSYVAADNDSGDDGYPLSKITYTPSKEELFYVRVGGSYYYYDYGTYVLEISPAPKSFKNFTAQLNRFDVRRASEHANVARWLCIRDRNQAGLTSRFLVRSPSIVANSQRFDARQVIGAAAQSNRFNAWKLPTEVIIPSRHDVRHPVRGTNHVRFDSRALQAITGPVRFDTRRVGYGHVVDRFESHGVVQTGIPSRHDALVRPGWALYARETSTSTETFLGFIPAESAVREIVDVPLPDGVYEIEVRPSEFYWEEARGRKVVTLIAGSGGGEPPVTGLPAIQNLRHELVGFTSVIHWNIAAEQAPDDFQFGVWFSTTSPVDTSGTPDQVVPATQGVGAYQITHQQSAAEFVAVAAYTATEMGAVAEIALPWDDLPPISPLDQVRHMVT